MTVMKINAVAFLEGKTPRLIFDVPRESGFFRVFSLIRVRFLGERRRYPKKITTGGMRRSF